MAKVINKTVTCGKNAYYTVFMNRRSTQKKIAQTAHTHFCMLVFKGHPGNVIALTNGPATDKHYVNPASSLRNARNGKIAFSELFLLQLSITKKLYT